MYDRGIQQWWWFASYLMSTIPVCCCQEMEEEGSSRTSFMTEEEEKLVNTKNAMHAKCKQLTQKCHTQEKEIERLKSKMQKMAEEVKFKNHMHILNIHNIPNLRKRCLDMQTLNRNFSKGGIVIVQIVRNLLSFNN